MKGNRLPEEQESAGTQEIDSGRELDTGGTVSRGAGRSGADRPKDTGIRNYYRLCRANGNRPSRVARGGRNFENSIATCCYRDGEHRNREAERPAPLRGSDFAGSSKFWQHLSLTFH